MSIAQTDVPAPRKPLRLWPRVAAAVLLCLVRFVIPVFVPQAFLFGVIGGFVCAFAIVVWWLFFSRAPWTERLGAVALAIVALFATSRIIHVSVATGMMGMMFPFYSIQVLCPVFVAWAVATRRLSDGLRRATMAATILLACGVFALLRTDGITGGAGAQWAWRWTKTPEQRLLAQGGAEPAAPGSAPAAAVEGADWPGFRGPGRDGVARGVRIATGWARTPPGQAWPRALGPGAGRVYTFGATGILNALDAGNGAVAWSRNVASETGTKVPMWGFASSPLVVDDVVIVAATGKLVAYDRATGDPRWSGPAHGMSYSSPQRATIDGVAQVLLLSAAGATSVAPATGTLLWEHSWPGFTIVQPALTADGDVLISTAGATGGIGMRRIGVAHGPGGWVVQERWTSDGLCPYFNDFVVHQGDAFGFDGSSLACIDLEHGTRKWEGGRYGNGQLVLLPDQDLLLVVSEEGELALVRATPDRFTEVARFPALKGKTWNHPVLVGDTLLVRNGQEMAAFRLPPERR